MNKEGKITRMLYQSSAVLLIVAGVTLVTLCILGYINVDEVPISTRIILSMCLIPFFIGAYRDFDALLRYRIE